MTGAEIVAEVELDEFRDASALLVEFLARYADIPGNPS